MTAASTQPTDATSGTESVLAEGGSHTTSNNPPARPQPPLSASDRFDEVLGRLQVLRSRKGQDYGTPEDSVANLRASEDFGIPAWVGCVLRGNDKMRRLMTFIQTDRLECEPADDALEDLAVYTIWAIVLRNEELAQQQQSLPAGKVVQFDDRSRAWDEHFRGRPA